ncbi:HAMP domain-containing histidine kinase [Schnuerera sp. xch1]|uniref:sensor histidine kinase n=1 Tax=Schnuerera sp. xch1 TaxID=2874283 RepID=UPI001CBE4409|nr:HAMP domain-containing sensor histidine kinase [Schnuerera sp. xch1]MBZ2174869.1 HAMP domain-containing histidine kinase [Schnuerera sp. xch1]
MRDIDEVLSEKNGFIGIISSNYGEDELEFFKKHIRNYLNNGSRIVYICSKKMKTKCLCCLKEYLIKSNKLIFICMEDYVSGDSIEITEFLEAVTRQVGKLSEDNDEKVYIYTTVDSLCNFIKKDELEYIYKKLRAMSKNGRAIFFVKYLIKEFNEEYVYNLFINHDFLLIYEVDDFEIYTPTQLVHQGLMSLLERKDIDHKYKKEHMRDKYLKNLGERMDGTIHDINNLLVSISGHAQYSLSLNDIKEIKKSLEIISKLALDGKSITQKVKNYIKGSYKCLKDIYIFDYIINNCIEMTKHKFKFSSGNLSNLELKIDLQSQQYVYGNEYDLRHSIINIILNGIDAMEDSGGVMTIRTYDKDDQIVLEISDTGKGMDENVLNKIFKPYFTTKGSNGTGLGLSIAKKIFERHDAKIDVETAVNRGTKFTIYFPSVELKFDNIEQNIYSAN